MRGVELGDLSPTDCTRELRLIPNSSLEWAIRRDSPRHTLLVPFVACAVGATASAAVILALVDFATTQTSVPPISARAIVRDASAFQGTTTAQNIPVVETPMQLAPMEPVTQYEENYPSRSAWPAIEKAQPSCSPFARTILATTIYAHSVTTLQSLVSRRQRSGAELRLLET